MNLKQAILEEHSKTHSARIAAYIRENPERFEELIDVFLYGSYRETQRVSTPLNILTSENFELIKPYIGKLLHHLTEKPNDTVVRNTLRLFQLVELPDKYQGIATEICFEFLINKKTAVAIRVFAMTILYNISEKNPDLKNELAILIEDQMPYATAALVSRGSKILKKLKGKKSKGDNLR